MFIRHIFDVFKEFTLIYAALVLYYKISSHKNVKYDIMNTNINKMTKLIYSYVMLYRGRDWVTIDKKEN
jgi:hypothetical protein